MYFIVVETDEKFVFLVDGSLRKIENPKKKKIKHIEIPAGTESWKPVPHMEVIDAVTDVVKAHNWQILDENFGLAREGQKMFGVMRINKT